MSKKDREKDEIDLNKYEDMEGLTIKKLNFGLWLSLHRRKINRALLVLLIIVAAGLFIYSTYSYVFYFLYGRQADQQLANSLTQTQVGTNSYREANTPKEIEVSATQYFYSDGKYDFVAHLQNPNPKHFSTFHYCFTDAKGGDLACGQSFILPGEGKYVLSLGNDLKNFTAATIKLKINDIFWQRLNAHDVPDWQKYLANRFDFPVSDLNYTPPTTGEKVSLQGLSFTINNNTAYSYASLPLNILLLNGNKIVGLNSYLLEDFRDGESRKINLSWPGGSFRASQVKVIPELNILDPQVYLPYQG